MPSSYSVVRRLGGGGMADVFLARDPVGRLVALKRMRDTTPELRVHFAREARVGALLQHPHVVRVEDVGEDAAGPFIALEYVDGVSAADLSRSFVQRNALLPVEVFGVLARDVTSGLEHAHAPRARGGAGGVLHRDLSPDNVLVSREGVAKLGDFGLAFLPEDTRVTRTGSVKGKLAHLAPELIDGAPPSIASDVYALGVTLFRLAAGVAPFRGNNDGELLRAILHGERPRLSALRPDLPRAVADWIQRSLEPKPDARPRLEELLALLPEGDAAARQTLGRAVEAATSQAVATPDPRERPPTQSLRAAPLALGAEPTERVPPSATDSTGRAAHAGALRSTGAASRPDDGEPTPVALQDAERTEQLPEPPTVKDAEPTRRLSPAPTRAPSVPRRPWLRYAGVAAVGLGVLGLAVARLLQDAPPAAPRVLPAVEPPGRLGFDVAGTVRVFVDEEPWGSTPLAPRALPPGRHTVLFIHGATGQRSEQDVWVPSGGDITVKLPR